MKEIDPHRIPRSRIHRSLGIAVAGGIAYLVSRFLSWSPGLVESAFVDGWARAVVPPFSRLTGLAPVPVIEILILAYGGWRIWTVWRAGTEVVRDDRPVGSAFMSGLLITARDLGIAVVAFYVLWGFHYARTPTAERLELPVVEAVPSEELEALSRELVEVANASYLELHGTEDAGAPTRMPRDWSDLDRALDLGWARTAAQLPVGPLVTADLGPVKPMILSPLVAHLGLTGIYSPFTAEPLVVGTTPAVSLGLSMAHEGAHQRGITGEGEATLLGFVAAMNSDHPLLRYSAAVRGQSRLLAALMRQDTTAFRRTTSLRLPGITRDLRDLAQYSLRHRGAPARVASRVNDTYLRANRVEGGIQSYDQATRLLVRLARKRGGTLVP